MSAQEIFIILICMYVGYVIVSALMNARKTQPVQQPIPELETRPVTPLWHEVLGVAPDASVEEIRRAYQSRSDEINAAFKEALKSRDAV